MRTADTDFMPGNAAPANQTPPVEQASSG